MARKASKPLTGAIGRWFPGLAVFAKCLGLIYSKRSMLRKLGYIQSVKERRPCRVDGTPIPWMNYNIIKFLEERLDKSQKMFEFGSGNSTLFYSERVASVISLETDKDWYDYCKSTMPDNVTLLFTDYHNGEPYETVIHDQDGEFDIVIVDSWERPECMRESVSKLSPGGVIILDDSHRDYYADAFSFMQAQGFRKIDFEGLKPAGIREYRSTVFYRPDNCLGI